MYRRRRLLSISAFIFNLSSNNSRSRYVAVSPCGWKGALGAGRVGGGVGAELGWLILAAKGK
jgi:hypothetical protein